MQTFLSILLYITPYLLFKLYHFYPKITKFVESIFTFYETFHKTVVHLNEPDIVRSVSSFLSKAQHTSNSLTILQHRQDFVLVPYNDGYMAFIDNRSFYILHEEKTKNDVKMVSLQIRVSEPGQRHVVGKMVRMALRDTHAKGELFELYRGIFWRKMKEALPGQEKVDGLPKDGLVLDEGVYENILAQIRDFRTKKSWYAQVGIPFRMGILLHGPHGNGKTSTARQVALDLRMTVSVLNVAEKNLNDEKLAKALRRLPKNTVVLFQNLHAVFDEGRGSRKKNRLTFSGLLNCLDGIATPSGMISFFIVEDVSRLDEALIRPGRCDLKVRYANASSYQIRKYLRVMFPEATEEQVQQFVSAIPEDVVSMKSLQNYFTQYQSSLDDALSNTTSLLSDNTRDHSTVDTETPIELFLRRMGMSHYLSSFIKQDIFTLKDIMPYARSYAKRMNLSIQEADRLRSILEKKDPQAISKFQTTTHVQLREVLQKHFPHAQNAELDRFVSHIPDKSVTIYQILTHIHHFRTFAECLEKISLLLHPPISKAALLAETIKYDPSIRAGEWIKSLLEAEGVSSEKSIEFLATEHIFTVDEMLEGKIKWEKVIDSKKMVEKVKKALDELKKQKKMTRG